MLAWLELDPAKMRLLYGFFDFYLKLNKEEEAEVMKTLKCWTRTKQNKY